MLPASYLMLLGLVYAFAWGAIWGSFANVVIWRVPLGMSVVSPPSRCPGCGSLIAWYDNVPILAWLWLRGRCRTCRAPISFRYPAVELLCAALSTALFWHVAHGREAEPVQVIVLPFLLLFYFVLGLVVISFIDLDHTIIPHGLTFPLMGWGLAGSLLLPRTGVWAEYFPSVDIVDSSLGLLLGAGFMLAISRGYTLVTGRVGLGGGDVTMMGMIGANLGWQSLLVVLFASSLQGVLAAVVLMGVEKARGQKAGGDGSVFLRGMDSPDGWDEDLPAPGASPESERDVGAPGAGASALSPAPGEAGALAESAESEVPADGDEAGAESPLRLALPYGPFLALAAVEYIFVGRPLMRLVTAGLYP